jgi:predicted homoserine dehydrogenase-like protein
MPTNVALTGLAKDLAARAETGKPVRIGLVGAGEMGTDIVSRVAHMRGIEIGAISELNPQAAGRSVTIAYGDPDRAVATDTTDALNAAIEQGRIATTQKVETLLESGLIDVVIDATGIPSVGAEIGLAAMERGKHLVMMNVEADVTIGAFLRSEAERLGVIYSLGAGDEPSSCMELIEFVSAMGHRIVSAGKGKNNPLNFDATPDTYTEEAVRRHMNPRMLVEFVDGSKTMVEMAAIANATGLIPDRPGMHGPAC